MKFTPEHRTRAATMAAVALAFTLAPRMAAAQTYVPDTSETPPPSQPEHKKGPGVALSVAGGVSSFARSSTRDFTDTGGSWDVRGVFGTRTLLGIEAAYVGTANGLDAARESATLVSHGVEGDLRLNLLHNGFAWAGGLQPYLLGGLAWVHYHVSGGDFSTASIGKSDDTMQVPVGGGVSYYFPNRMLIDARFAYRFAFSDSLIQGSSLDSLSLVGRLGLEF
jgi:opacity protein-like surface antigen